MTPEKRAEKIADWLYPERKKYRICTPSLFEKMVTAQIKEAERDIIEQAAGICKSIGDEHCIDCCAGEIAEEIRAMKGEK